MSCQGTVCGEAAAGEIDAEGAVVFQFHARCGGGVRDGEAPDADMIEEGIGAGFRGARRATREAAGFPCVRRSLALRRASQHERMPGSVGGPRPAAAVVVGNFQHHCA